MSSVALAVTSAGMNPEPAAYAMLAGMRDRSRQWAVAAGGSMALGAGADDLASARRQLVTLAGGTITLGLDMPAWARRELEPKLAKLEGHARVPSPEPLASDAHCVATIGSRGCVAYRGVMSSRPLFYASGADLPLLAASQIRGIRAARPTAVSLPGPGSIPGSPALRPIRHRVVWHPPPPPRPRPGLVGWRAGHTACGPHLPLRRRRRGQRLACRGVSPPARYGDRAV